MKRIPGKHKGLELLMDANIYAIQSAIGFLAELDIKACCIHMRQAQEDDFQTQMRAARNFMITAMKYQKEKDIPPRYYWGDCSRI